MKDVEQLLSKHIPKPSRTLRASFTQSVIATIQDGPKQHKWRVLRNRLHTPLLSKTSLLSLAGVVLLGSGAAAIVLWPTPSVTPTMSQALPSGNHIVGYNAKNCNYFGAPSDAVGHSGTNEQLYYEVRQGSKLTDQQLQDALEGVCEENVSNAEVTSIIKKLPGNTSDVVSSLTETIHGITKDTISLALDPHYPATIHSSQPGITYSHFAPTLLIYNESNLASYSDLKIGDSVKIVVRDTAEAKGNYNPLNHSETAQVLAIIKVPPLTANPELFYEAVGGDLVRLEPCKNSPTGFCRAYNFINESTK